MQARHIDHPVYIDSDDALSLFCKQWSKSELLALDTEFIRTDTFYPIGALIQVSDGSGCFLIDPLAIDDFSSFSALLTDSTIVKVLHSCSEDLEVFERLFGVVPRPLIDTQIAAAMDGHGFSLGYQRLTEILLQIHVAKGETRSNWLQRPLTDSQIHYAALDVAHLPAMYQLLIDSLRRKGRLPWLQEDCETLVRAADAGDNIDHYYKKVKSCWKLSARELGILQALTVWREHTARQKDLPRGRVLKDRCCYDIARLQPKNLRELSAVADVGAKTLRNYGESILDTVDNAQALADDQLPAKLPKPLPPQASQLLKLLKSHISQRAQQLQIAAELLAKKRDCEALLRSGVNNGDYQLPETLSGWRRAVVGNELLELIDREQ